MSTTERSDDLGKTKNIFAKAKSCIPDWMLPVIASLLSGVAMTEYLSLNTTSIFSLVFLFLMYPIFRMSFRQKSKKVIVTSYIIGFFYATALALFRIERVFKSEKTVIWFVFLYLGMFIAFSNLLIVIYTRLLKSNFCIKNPEKRKTGKLCLAAVFFSCMIIMLIGWLPYYLSAFPGNVTADSHWQIMQITGMKPYSNHHPVACTVMIKMFYNLGISLFGGNQTYAVATANECQAILLSAAFSYMLMTLYKFKVKLAVIIPTLAFYTIIPYNFVYSVTMWKDVWFAGIVVVLSTTLWRLIKYYKDGESHAPVFEIIMLFVFGVGMCLFRSNGLYAYLVLVPFIFFYFIKKNWAVALSAVIALPMVFFIKGPVYTAMGVEPPDMIESLSIPAQHIARAICDGAELTAEQRELLSHVVDIDRVSSKYLSYISDPIKDLVRDTGDQEYLAEHKKEFLKLWIDIGKKYPKSYILAQIDQTYGYWFPDVQYWVYPKEFRNTNYDFEKTPLVSDETSTAISEYMESYKQIPYFGLLWSIGTASWVCLFMFGMCYLKKKHGCLIIYIPVLAVLATLMIATPVYAEFRYAYSLFTTLPLLSVIPFVMNNRSNKENGEAVLGNAPQLSSLDDGAIKDRSEPAEKNGSMPFSSMPLGDMSLNNMPLGDISLAESGDAMMDKDEASKTAGERSPEADGTSNSGDRSEGEDSNSPAVDSEEPKTDDDVEA